MVHGPGVRPRVRRSHQEVHRQVRQRDADGHHGRDPRGPRQDGISTVPLGLSDVKLVVATLLYARLEESRARTASSSSPATRSPSPPSAVGPRGPRRHVPLGAREVRPDGRHTPACCQYLPATSRPPASHDELNLRQGVAPGGSRRRRRHPRRTPRSSAARRRRRRTGGVVGRWPSRAACAHVGRRAAPASAA